jgi:hypothetical protein
MESGVGELRLRVRAPPGSAAEPGEAERFARRVLESLAAEVEARWPGRVVLLRELSMSWRLAAGELASQREATELARTIADALAEQLEGAGDGIAAGGDVAAFADDAAYLAAYLDALPTAESARAWYFRGLATEPPRHWTDRTVWRSLGRLWHAGRLPPVLSSLPPEWLERVLDLVGERGSGALPTRSPARAGPIADAARALPARLEEAEAWVCLSVAAAELLPASSPAERADAVRTGLAAWRARGHAEPAKPEPAADLQDGHGITADASTTEWAGAVYLLRLAMDLGVGEILWRACLAEGPLFGAALRLLLGPDAAADPLLRLLGDERPVEAIPEQQEEAGVELLAAYVADRQRHRDDLPAVRLGLRHRPGDRLLVACPDRGAFPCFAWPAGTTAGLARGMAAFLDRWPVGSVRPEASPGLAVLDPTGRTRLALDAQVSGALRVPDELAAPLAALQLQLAGVLGAAWSSRLELDGAEPEALAARYFGLPGRVYVSPNELVVVLPMDRIDIAMRRAGLDRDPGWVPWLERRVRVEFEEAPAG